MVSRHASFIPTPVYNNRQDAARYPRGKLLQIHFFFFFPTLSSVVRLDSESSTGRFIDLLLAIVIDRFSATSLHRNLCKMLDANEVRTACSLFGMARCI